jgi:uncharacterized protein YggE
MKRKVVTLLASLLLAAQVQAQSTTGTMVVVPAMGEVSHANDQATATFMVEEQHKDKTVAASRVNQKMKQGTELVRKMDPQAKLKTQGYYTYAVYPEQRPMPIDAVAKPREPTSWRVGQYLEVKTTNLDNLPKMTAAVQSVLALNHIHFGLSPATSKKLDAERIALTYQNLTERIASIAQAMGRNPSDATYELIDFEGSGQYGGQQEDRVEMKMMRASAGQGPEQVAEPSFEPGETTLQMRLVGKVKFN